MRFLTFTVRLLSPFPLVEEWASSCVVLSCQLGLSHFKVLLCFPVHCGCVSTWKICSVVLHRTMLFGCSRCLSVLPVFHNIFWKYFVCLESQEWFSKESKYSCNRNFWYNTGGIQCAQLISPYGKVKMRGKGWGGWLIRMALGHLKEYRGEFKPGHREVALGLRCQKQVLKKHWGEGFVPCRAMQQHRGSLRLLGHLLFFLGF